MKLLERAWESYLSIVISKDAGPLQIKETRQAFYSGATILFSVLTSEQFFDEGEAETIEDMAKMKMIQDELDAFGVELDLAVLDILDIKKH